jgi:general secretion pathway protein D
LNKRKYFFLKGELIMRILLSSFLMVLLSVGTANNLAPGPPESTDPNSAIVQTQVFDPNLQNKKVSLNFRDASLATIVDYLSEVSGLVIVSDDVVLEQKLTVISKQDMTIDEQIALINTLLKENGFAAIRMGRTLRIVSIEKAKTMNIPVTSGNDPKKISPGDEIITHVVPIGYIDAVALKENLTPLIPSYASLEANKEGNSLIITDTTANIRRLMEIVQAIDTHMSMVTEIRVFRLINADATSAANLITNLFKQQQQGGTTQSQQGGFRGPFEMMQQQSQDRGGRGGRSSGESSSQTGGVNASVAAAADTQTNSVVVRGSKDTLDVIENMIKALDDRTSKVADVRVFQLRYADATNTADVINQLFGKNSESSNQRGNQQGNMPFFFRGGPGASNTTQQSETGGAFSVNAAADSRTNTVVVTGPESMLEVVAGVIKNLDSPLANVADVKVFHLQYADATDTSELINEVFGQSRTTSSARSSRSSGQTQQVQFMGRGGGAFGQQAASSAGSTSDVTVIASADSRTNSVVVSGPPETLEVIAQIIKQLDENPEQERRIFVYALKNANATNLMTILGNLFAELQTLNQQATGRTGQQFQGGQRAGSATTQTSSVSDSLNSTDLSEETYFEADPNTNSLLCMTSTKNYDKIKPIIEELDKPVGQVLIKILFAEVTHTNSLDLGTEFSMLNLRTDSKRTGTLSGDSLGTSIIKPGSGTGYYGDNLGNSTRSGTSFGVPLDGGLSARVIQGEIDLTLTALEKVGRLNVLSRPYILTRNNQPATITVAQQVPIPEGTTTVAGQTQTTINYRDDIGIVLTVTPSINPDGLVNMTVNPSITTRTAEQVKISETLSAETFATRSATTRVAVLDGQTIVIGGLIEDQMKNTVKKVPLLGDIPIAGNLFKRTIKEKTKTELLIFLTPFVAKEPGELTKISENEERTSNIGSDKSSAEVFKKHMDAMKGLKDVNEPKN